MISSFSIFLPFFDDDANAISLHTTSTSKKKNKKTVGIRAILANKLAN
jgi:hypothetical protein